MADKEKDLDRVVAKEMLEAKLAVAGVRRPRGGRRLNSIQLAALAAENGIPHAWLEKVRGKYLDSKRQALEERLANIKEQLPLVASEAEYLLLEMDQADVAAQIDDLSRQRKQLSRQPGTGRNDVTEQMKEVARSYPITEFIEFDKRRKAICPFHAEKTPSMHLYDTEDGGGKARCYGECNRFFNSIDYVMIKMELGFLDAVRFLNGVPLQGGGKSKN